MTGARKGWCSTDAEVGVDVPQERGAIIFAQGRPIGRSIVPNAVACTCRCSVWAYKTRVKPPPSPSPPPPPRTFTSGVLARVRSTRDALSSALSISSFPTSPFLSFSPSVSLYFTHHPPRVVVSFTRTQYKQQKRARVRLHTRIVESVRCDKSRRTKSIAEGLNYTLRETALSVGHLRFAGVAGLFYGVLINAVTRPTPRPVADEATFPFLRTRLRERKSTLKKTLFPT
nr:PREDICTED: uncharacterized protein LOC105673838 [Linepithema humile]